MTRYIRSNPWYREPDHRPKRREPDHRPTETAWTTAIESTELARMALKHLQGELQHLDTEEYQILKVQMRSTEEHLYALAYYIRAARDLDLQQRIDSLTEGINE